MLIANPLPLHAEGLLLRRLSVADLAAFQAYRCDEDLARYQGWSAQSDAQASAFLAEMGMAPLLRPGQWSQLGLALAAEPAALLGDIGLCLDEDEHEFEIGMSLSRQAQGRGLATIALKAAIALAFAQTTAQRVRAVTDARNSASIRLVERLGMQRERSEPAWFKGEACVEHHYTLGRPSPAVAKG